MAYKITTNDAYAFVIASKLLEATAVTGLNECEDEKTGNFLAHIIIPSLVLGSFSCELILKKLITHEQKEAEGICRINSLFRLLNEPIQNAIVSSVISKMKEHNTNYTKMDFHKDLDNLTNIFDDWRYFLHNFQYLNEAFFNTFFGVLISYIVNSKNK